MYSSVIRDLTTPCNITYLKTPFSSQSCDMEAQMLISEEIVPDIILFKLIYTSQVWVVLIPKNFLISVIYNNYIKS